MNFIARVVVACTALAVFTTAQSVGIQVGEQCPNIRQGTPVVQVEDVPGDATYAAAVASLDMDAVLQDIVTLLTDSQECWPADSFDNSVIGQSYGGLFVRLTWHCAGSYRNTDELGGCAGGEMRFQPESSWRDNTNLDKARALLYPIKAKYGDALSWGDLIVLAGNAAIMHMGGPVAEMCVGRIDNSNGERSFPLGFDGDDCGDDGNCTEPIGSNSIGLIYVNPEGFQGVADPAGSAVQIRKVFARMNMNDTETVALVGGGHAFGRSHGACEAGAGPSPADQPATAYNPWPGMCGTGRGLDTFTSGIEGYWTSDPLMWDNEYFQLLRDNFDEYQLGRGSGGAQQWSRTPGEDSPLIMMTTDLALFEDPDYRAIVTEYANDINVLNVNFAQAWKKLTEQGGEFSTAKKCFTPQWPRDPVYVADALLTDEEREARSGSVSTFATSNVVVAVAMSVVGTLAAWQ